MAPARVGNTLFGDVADVLGKGDLTGDLTTALQALPLPSEGSATHGEGTCRPCAHSWKPSGCSKGQACTFCHLCDESDFRRRRKEREAQSKVQKKGGKLEDGSALWPTDSCDMGSLTAKAQVAVAPIAEAVVDAGSATPQQASMCDTICRSACCQTEEAQEARSQQLVRGTQIVDEQRPGASALPSVGSTGHAEGTCRPCAHSWKPGGCSKGFSCTFCHLCREDDFRKKRKDRASFFRAQKALPIGDRALAEDTRDTGSEGSSTFNEVPSPSRDTNDWARPTAAARGASALPVVSSLGKPRSRTSRTLMLPPGLFADAVPTKSENYLSSLWVDAVVSSAIPEEPAYVPVQPDRIKAMSVVDSLGLGYLRDLRHEDCRSTTNFVMNPGEPAHIPMVFCAVK